MLIFFILLSITLLYTTFFFRKKYIKEYNTYHKLKHDVANYISILESSFETAFGDDDACGECHELAQKELERRKKIIRDCVEHIFDELKK